MDGTQRLEVMTMEAYMGAQQAMAMDFGPVVTPLFNFARDRASRLPADKAFPVSTEAMTLQEARYHSARLGLSSATIKLLQTLVTSSPDPAVVDEARALLDASLVCVCVCV